MQHQLVGTRSITTFLLLFVALASGNMLLAQSPAYLFANGFGSADANSSGASDVAVDGSGNSYAIGYFQGTVDFDPGSGTASLSRSGSADADIFLASYDVSGNYRWAFRIGNTMFGKGSIALDGSGNVVVAGLLHGVADFDPGSGRANLASAKVSGNIYSEDIFVARYSSSGSYLSAFRLGSTGNELASAVAIDGSGNICITGSFGGTVDFNPGSGTNNLVSAGGDDAFVARYSSSGVYSWAFRVGGNSSMIDAGSEIAVDGGGYIVVSGRFGGTVDFDPGSGTSHLTSNTGNDFFVARYSSSGIYQWAFKPMVLSGQASAVGIDGSGNIYLTGGFRGANDFDPGAAIASLDTASNGLGGFVVKYSSAGGYIWGFSMPGYVFGRGIAIDGSGTILVAGNFRGTVDFDPGSTTASQTAAASTSGSDIVIGSYSQSSQPKRAVRENSASITLLAAPNPFTGALTVSHDGTAAPARIEIVDMMGRVVETIDDVAPRGEIRLGEELPAGAYLVRVRQGDLARQTLVRKLR